MSTLRLARLARGPFDHALARLSEGLLWRSAEGLYLDVAAPLVPALVRALAYAGVRATTVDAVFTEPEGLVAARGRSLAPVFPPVRLDAIRIAASALGADCARLLSFPLPYWPGARARIERCRGLLREEDAAYRWSRIAWSAPAILRERSIACVLRAAVFERASLEAPLRGRGYASDGALARWAFA